MADLKTSLNLSSISTPPQSPRIAPVSPRSQDSEVSKSSQKTRSESSSPPQTHSLADQRLRESGVKQSTLESGKDTPPVERRAEFNSSQALYGKLSEMGSLSGSEMGQDMSVSSPRGEVAPQPQPQPSPKGWKEATTSLSAKVCSQLRPGYTPMPSGTQETDSPEKYNAFINHLDPFGRLQIPEGKTDSTQAKFKTLAAKQCQPFLQAVSITDNGACRDTAPDEATLSTELEKGGDENVTDGVPKLSHAIWVGGPLKMGETKHKAFMDQLVENKEKNKDDGWDVCLWTDQSRDAFINAPDDSDLGRMRDWAAKNGIRLIPIDEVFAGETPMSTQGLYQTESLKGGTGRAAASDLIRLEIIDRFGGIYADGDKPLESTMNQIASHTDKHGGFTAARDPIMNAFQNCGMCGKPNNDISKAVLENIRAKYGMPRDAFLDHVKSPGKNTRPTRVEVIQRTGPSVVRDVALAVEKAQKGKDILSKDSQHLMPEDFIRPSSKYTTSWDPSLIPCHGDTNLVALSEKGEDIPTPESTIENVKAKVQSVRSDMQKALPAVSLTEVQEAEMVVAVEKSVTAMVYGVWNQGGVLNFDLAEKFIHESPNPDLAREMILEVFASDEFKAVTQQVTALQLPTKPATKDKKAEPVLIPEASLDKIFRKEPPLFPNLDPKGFTLQHAAYSGNIQFLDYAARHHMLDYDAKCTPMIEAGAYKGRDGFATDSMNVFKAALLGGQTEALAFLSSQETFSEWVKDSLGKPESENPLKMAADRGQIDTLMLCLQALPESERKTVDAADLLERLMNAKPKKDEKLTDAQQRYVFEQFEKGMTHLLKADLDLKTSDFSLLLKKALQSDNQILATAMESKGASLENLTKEQEKTMLNEISNQVYVKLFTKGALNIALKTDLAKGMLNKLAAKIEDINAHKDKHTPIPNVDDTEASIKYLANGLAYANDHIAHNQSGRRNRVEAWRNGVGQIKQQLEGIPPAERTIEQKALFEMVAEAETQLNTMRRKQFRY